MPFWLQAETNAVAARAVTDRKTHTHTHTQSKYCNPHCACAPRVNKYIGIGYIFGTHVMYEGYSSCLSVTTQCQCIPETNDTHRFLLGFCWILTCEVLKNVSFKYIRAHCEPYFLDQQNTGTTGQLVGLVLLQRLDTGATRIKQAR